MAATTFQYSTTGFYKTPVSKGLLGCMFLTSCALNVPLLAHWKKYFAWTYDDVFIKYEVWRLGVSKTTFFDTKDLICGSLLIYYFRIFERRYGSHKYAGSLAAEWRLGHVCGLIMCIGGLSLCQAERWSWRQEHNVSKLEESLLRQFESGLRHLSEASCLLATTVATTVMELLVATILHYLEMDEQPILHQSGSYGFIFPLFISYFFDIPRVAQTSVLGIPVTGKTLTYLLGLQMVSCSKTSAISGVCGLVAGLMYRYNFLKIQSLIFIPKLVARTTNALFGWLLQSSPPQDGLVPMGATIEIQRQQQLEALEQQILLNHAREMRHMPPSNQEQFYAGSGGRFFGSQNDYVYQEAGTGVRQRAGAALSSEGDEPGSPGPSVREEQVQQLVEMGFDRQSVLEALRTSNYDMNIATNMLLQDS